MRLAVLLLLTHACWEGLADVDAGKGVGALAAAAQALHQGQAGRGGTGAGAMGQHRMSGSKNMPPEQIAATNHPNWLFTRSQLTACLTAV
jgi:hypothetical protein